MCTQATVAPTFANVNTVHVLRTDTITFIGVQQWLAAHLGLELQLLAGTYVVVPAHDIPLLGELKGCASTWSRSSNSSRAG
jgi:hypothetical protein